MDFLTKGKIARRDQEAADGRAQKSAKRRGLKERIKFRSSRV
jgi:hypothetical protein